MSRHGSITVECDSAHCHAESVYSASDLDDWGLHGCMSDDGWVERDGKHICAQCITEEQPEDPRERGDDDGVEYSDPRDHRAGRE